MRKIAALLCAAQLILCASGMADTLYEGKTAATCEISVEAQGGVLTELMLEAGMTVEQGDTVGLVRTEKVFAAEDGTVVRLHAQEGETADGTVLEIAPEQKYRIYCTVGGAYEDTENMLVHSGAQAYVKCTADGTHLAVGVITQIDGSEYQLLTTGGELYIGETVYLYNAAECETQQRIGIGTVVANETITYEADGRILRMHVEEGERVERGELLYEIVSGKSDRIEAPVSGIVTQICVQKGEKLMNGNTVALIAPQEEICVEIFVSETDAAELSAGMEAWIVFAADPDMEQHGMIISVARIAEDGVYRVQIMPDEGREMRIGESVAVRIET